MRTLTVTAVTAVLMAVATTGATQASPSPRSARASGHHRSMRSTTHRVRPDQADWETIKEAAHTRDLGLERHRTAHFRAFAGELGLNELSTVQPLAPGRCRAAVRALYGNLLDLANAHPGENWTPLRRFVAKEPSIRACAPRRGQPQAS
ncbi:MAG TPA: hypothetical protein VFH80_21145 [Solirubrobacteraceae bacterium]|nr:hypothetical protein [Solirubrobacteraceae bacterium]